MIGFVQPTTTVLESDNAVLFVTILDGSIQPGESYPVTVTTSDGSATGKGVEL